MYDNPACTPVSSFHPGQNAPVLKVEEIASFLSSWKHVTQIQSTAEALLTDTP